MSLWHRFLSLFCCVSVQTTQQVPRLTTLCEPALVKWVNSFMASSGKAITKLVDLAKDLRFVEVVEAIADVDISSLKKKCRWKRKKRLVQKAIACLVGMEIIAEEEHSSARIVQGDSDEIRNVLLKLLVWFINSKQNAQKQEVKETEVSGDTIKRGVSVLTDVSQKCPVKHSQSMNDNFKASGKEQQPEMSTMKRNSSCPVMISNEKTCSREVVETLLEELINAAVAEAENANRE